VGPFVTRITAQLRAIGPDRLMTGLMVILALFIVVQPFRLGSAGIWAWRMGRSVDAAAGAAPARNDADPLEQYDAILEQGFIGGRTNKGEPPKPSLFGILGNEVFLGMSADKAKFYGVGAEVPGGEKIVSIGTNEAVLEKDGEKRTVTVFGGPDDKRPGSPAPKEPQAPPEGTGPKGPPAEGPKEEVPVEAAPPNPPPSSGASLNSETMVGTKWSYQGTSLSFDSDGKLTIAAGDETIEGTWSLDGDTITVEVMGEEHTAQIDGDTITVDGNTIERVE
jgi:hypothetical protein